MVVYLGLVETSFDPAALDVGSLALFVGQAAAEAVRAELAEQGFADVRFSHGFVFQHLVGAQRTITELAGRLEVSQQAASKTVGELEALGYLATQPDPDDARRRVVVLTARGEAVIEAARRVRRKLEKRFERRHGRAALEACRATLLSLLHDLGGTEAVRRRRVPSPR
jgi:DNA-binding MarR family transcriptional regulator